MNYKQILLIYSNDYSEIIQILKHSSKIVILPTIEQLGNFDNTKKDEYSDPQNPEIESIFHKIQILIAPKLKRIGKRCFEYSNIIKLIGGQIEQIDDESFYEAKFLSSIDLRQTKTIGTEAFYSTNLKEIRNDVIIELNKDQFLYQSELKLVQMRNLNKLNTSAFGGCIINKFDAPKLDSVEESEENEENRPLVFEKNFKDCKAINKASKIVQEPDYDEIMKKLPKVCFEQFEVTKSNSEQFIIDGIAIFPPNIKIIGKAAYSSLKTDIQYVYGFGVLEIQESAFSFNFRLRKAVFPKVETIDNQAFSNDNQLHTLIAPICTNLGKNVFLWCVNLKHFVMKPKIIQAKTFQKCGLTILNLPSVTHIEEMAFHESALTNLNVCNLDLEQQQKVLKYRDLQKVEVSFKKRFIDQKQQLSQLKEIQEMINRNDRKLLKQYLKIVNNQE